MTRRASLASFAALAVLALSPRVASAGGLPTSTDEARRLAESRLAGSPSSARPAPELVTTTDEARLAAATRVAPLARAGGTERPSSVTSTDQARAAAAEARPEPDAPRRS